MISVDIPGGASAEGGAAQTLRAADVVVREIGDALDLLVWPQRLIATLRA
jgi:soluble P-type ATPase